jgi:ribonuclease HI
MESTFDLAQLGKKKVSMPTEKISQWQRPEMGVLKINVDASFDVDARQGTSALVTRDHDGFFVFGQLLWYSNSASALIMEVLAICDGVQLALDCHYNMVEIESDAKEVLHQMEDPEDGKSEMACIYQKIKELSGFLSRVKFSYIGRQANEAAHACAKRASSDRRRFL